MEGGDGTGGVGEGGLEMGENLGRGLVFGRQFGRRAAPEERGAELALGVVEPFPDAQPGPVAEMAAAVAEGGEDLRGEDTLTHERPLSFALRFHLHSAVKAVREKQESGAEEEGGAVLLTLPSGAVWRLRADSGRLGIEESIYLGAENPTRSQQLVIAVAARPVVPNPPAAEDAGDTETPPVQPPTSHTVRWAISRVES